MSTDTTMELTHFHLGRKQKSALRTRAQAEGTNVAEELRRAVEAYLSGGITPEEVALLDMATRKAQDDLAEMSAQLEATNRKAERIFAELEHLREQQPAATLSARAAAKKPATSRGAK